MQILRWVQPQLMSIFLLGFVQILDHEVEVASSTGKAHAVIPAFIFYRDRNGDEDEKQSRRGKYIMTP